MAENFITLKNQTRVILNNYIDRFDSAFQQMVSQKYLLSEAVALMMKQWEYATSQNVVESFLEQSRQIFKIG
eukprot:snap_masked-scaffold_13-processed-gene-9.18-mRNA-1 protein AED:1.00 eAED:1.00 QI:0/-1/0/0/-1/1/1/0/71